MKRLILALLILGASFSAYAQTPVVTYPYGVTSFNSSGSISVTNTFQSVFAASGINTGRVACMVQNNGTNPMWVFFGPIANATKGKSVVLAAGVSVQCNAAGGIVLKDQVSITGTSGDAFFAAQQ